MSAAGDTEDSGGAPGWLAGAPLFAAWRAFADADNAPFTIPGHKRNAAVLDPALGRLLDADVPLYGGLDRVKLTGGVLADAERRGALLWGADWCRFSTGGSTHANQAVCMALGRPGDTVIVSRTAHRSTLLGLVMSGLRPVWVQAEIDERFGVPSGMSVPALHRAIDEHPDAAGVLCVEPGYLGTISDLPAVVAAAHRRGMPVVVDQAWGAHLGFAPGYPPHALAIGADAMVTSAHKTLPAFSQAALVLARTERLDPDRLARAFDAGHTTSPAGAILASIDAARALLADPAGVALLSGLTAAVARLRTALRAGGLRTLAPQAFPGRFDPAKLVITTAESGHCGLLLEEALLARGLPVEMADRDTVVPLVSMADDERTLGRLGAALLDAAEASWIGPRPVRVAGQWRHDAPQLLSPREAFFAPRETVPITMAEGRISAEVVAPYPPGVPILVPGEQITAGSLGALASSLEAGTRIAYAADPRLHTVQVVRPGP